jgi:hypothetical protein
MIAAGAAVIVSVALIVRTSSMDVERGRGLFRLQRLESAPAAGRSR